MNLTEIFFSAVELATTGATDIPVIPFDHVV